MFLHVDVFGYGIGLLHEHNVNQLILKLLKLKFRLFEIGESLPNKLNEVYFSLLISN